MPDDKEAKSGALAPSGAHGWPGSGSVVRWQVLQTVSDMTPAAAEAHKKVAELTYAVPAKEETKRAWLGTARHYGTLCLLGVIVYFLAPHLSDPTAIAALGGVALIVFGVLEAIKRFKGGD